MDDADVADEINFEEEDDEILELSVDDENEEDLVSVEDGSDDSDEN